MWSNSKRFFFCVERGRCQSSSLFCADVKLDVVAKPQRQGKKSRSIHVQRVEQLSGKPSNKKSFSLDSVQWKEAEMENERRLKDNCTTVLLLLCWCCVLAPISGERETLVNSYLSGIVFPGHFWLLWCQGLTVLMTRTDFQNKLRYFWGLYTLCEYEGVVNM